MTQTRSPMSSSSFVAALSPTLSHPLGSGSVAGHNDRSATPAFVPQRMMALRGSAGVITWLEAVDRRLQLPNSFHAFSLALGGLLLFVAGAFLLMLPSVQMIETQVELRELRKQYAMLEQKNSDTLFAIARETNLMRLQERAIAQGYVPIGDRTYVMLPASTAVTARDTLPTDGSNAPLQPALAAQPTQPNWRSWEALLGLGDATTPQIAMPGTVTASTTPARWDAWWQGTLEWGEGRPWDDLTGRILDRWSGR